MRDYGKIKTAFWTDVEIQSCSSDAKVLALYLLSGPHTSMIGCFRLPISYIAEDLDWDHETVAKGFQELFEKGFARYDKATKYVFICNFIKHNPLENPNQVKGAKKVLDSLPDSIPFRAEIADQIEKQDKRFAKGSETLSKPETETETEDISASDDAVLRFEKFWEACPKKVDKKKTRTAFLRLSKSKQELAIADYGVRYRGVDKQFIPGPLPYIHGEKWEDELVPRSGGTAAPPQPRRHREL